MRNIQQYTLEMQVEDDRLLRQAHYQEGYIAEGDALLAVIKEKQSIIIHRRRIALTLNAA